MNIRQPLRSHEYGGVLITGLLTLTVLTAIGFMATRSSVMENEIASNERGYKEAFYASEVAVKNGEEEIKEMEDPDLYKKKGRGFKGQVLSGENDMPTNKPEMIDETDQDFHITGLPPTGTPSDPIVPQQYAEPPRFTVWNMYKTDHDSIGKGTNKGVNFFTVVGHGTGAKQDAKGFATTVFAHRFNR